MTKIEFIHFMYENAPLEDVADTLNLNLEVLENLNDNELYKVIEKKIYNMPESKVNELIKENTI